MWIFTPNGFLSIVSDTPRAKKLTVRARVAGHLEAIFPGHPVTVTPDRDYRYRAMIPREAVAQTISGLISVMGYPNFKDEVHEPAYHRAAGRCWGAMHDLQTDALRKGGRKMKQTRLDF